MKELAFALTIVAMLGVILHTMIPCESHYLHIGDDIGKVNTDLDKEIDKKLLTL